MYRRVYLQIRVSRYSSSEWVECLLVYPEVDSAKIPKSVSISYFLLANIWRALQFFPVYTQTDTMIGLGTLVRRMHAIAFNIGPFDRDRVSRAFPWRKRLSNIFFSGDGMGIPTVTAGRILKGQMRGESGEETKLAMDKFPHLGLSRVRPNTVEIAYWGACGRTIIIIQIQGERAFGNSPFSPKYTV